MPPFVIGLIGEPRAGKGTFIETLRDFHNVEVASTSALIGNTLTSWGIEKSRRNMQRLPVLMEEEWGKGLLAQAMESRIRRLEGIVVYDSIRWQADLDTVKKFQHLIVSITAHAPTRWQRAVASAEKVGDTMMTFDEFAEAETQATETEIAKLRLHSDATLENNGSIEDFRKAVRNFNKHKLTLHLEYLERSGQ